jgi:uncharacterized protein YjbI with pentapeptide repeats
MADSDDLEELLRGNTDMARRDLRGANLSGLDLSGRDFTAAHLEKVLAEKANFSEAKLSGLHSRGMAAPAANFNGVVAEGTVFFGMNLRGTSFRDAKLAASHFSGTNFDGADLVGADFRRAVINEGCNFENAIVDSTTRFEGAAIFRPLARQDAFRFYRVERGVLVRRDETEIAQLSSGSSPDLPGVDLAPEDPPRYTDLEGTIDVDYRRFDGRVFIGNGQFEFETKWSTAGNGSINVYRDPPSLIGIAVAPDVNRIEAVTADHFERADFTSRTRTPSTGEVVLLRNRNGYSAAIQIVAVKVGPESQARTRLIARYRILADGGSNFSAVEAVSVYREIRLAADAALANLGAVGPSADAPQTAGIGHNNPPSESALTAEDYEAVTVTLISLRDNATAEADPALLATAREKLVDWRAKIVSWAKIRLDQIQEGFFNQLGVTLADPQRLVAAWLLVSGSLTSVVDAIVRALS